MRLEENQFGRGMNATLFGNEISRRFEKKTTKIGRMYQGIGLLASGEGLVKGFDSDTIASESTLEANADDGETRKGEGCEGLHQVFPSTAIESHSIGQNREKPFTPFTNSTIVNAFQQASEADIGQNSLDSQPFTHPSHSRQYVQTVDGLGYLAGNQREQDVTIFSEEKKERLRYKIAVIILKDGIERFYYPQTIWEASPEDIQAYEQSSEVQS